MINIRKGENMMNIAYKQSWLINNQRELYVFLALVTKNLPELVWSDGREPLNIQPSEMSYPTVLLTAKHLKMVTPTVAAEHELDVIADWVKDITAKEDFNDNEKYTLKGIKDSKTRFEDIQLLINAEYLNLSYADTENGDPKDLLGQYDIATHGAENFNDVQTFYISSKTKLINWSSNVSQKDYMIQTVKEVQLPKDTSEVESKFMNENKPSKAHEEESNDDVMSEIFGIPTAKKAVDLDKTQPITDSFFTYNSYAEKVPKQDMVVLMKDDEQPRNFSTNDIVDNIDFAGATFIAEKDYDKYAIRGDEEQMFTIDNGVPVANHDLFLYNSDLDLYFSYKQGESLERGKNFEEYYLKGEVYEIEESEFNLGVQNREKETDNHESPFDDWVETNNETVENEVDDETNNETIEEETDNKTVEDEMNNEMGEIEMSKTNGLSISALKEQIKQQQVALEQEIADNSGLENAKSEVKFDSDTIALSNDDLTLFFDKSSDDDFTLTIGNTVLTANQLAGIVKNVKAYL